MELKQLLKFYEALQDDESRRLFKIKYDMLYHKNYNNFIDELIKLNYQWKIDLYDDFRPFSKNKKIAIFGAGSDGRMTYDILIKNNVLVSWFCDNDIKKQGTKINNIEVVSPEVILREADCFIIIASQKQAGNMLHQLSGSRFPRENIWYPRLGALYATTGWQYFDCPELERGEEEIFIDAGCFDVDTSRAFVKWCKGQYKRIIAFEPDLYNYSNCLRSADLKKFELLPYAA